jgi:hypothetical protein
MDFDDTAVQSPSDRIFGSGVDVGKSDLLSFGSVGNIADSVF